MQLAIGDRVKFLNDEGEGIVTGFADSGLVQVRDRDGFTYEHAAGELVPVGDRVKEYDKYSASQPDIIDVVERNLDPDVQRKATEQFKVLYKNREATNVKRKGESMEVDLHIHELLERHNHLSNGEIIQIQLEHFERTLKNAELKKIPRVVYIHGIGQGVLRAEIRKMLHQYYPHCTFMDGPYNEYGYGATEVRISQRRQ
ncbi:MAG: Smr/MutS family protein [Flavobacteriales bacterium]